MPPIQGECIKSLTSCVSVSGAVGVCQRESQPRTEVQTYLMVKATPLETMFGDESNT
jgi:hypothetical protein